MRHALSGGVLSFSLIGIGIILGISSAAGQSSQEGTFTGPDFHGIWLTRAGFGPPRDPSLPGGVVTLAENDYDPDYRLGDSSNPVLKPSAVAGIEAGGEATAGGGLTGAPGVVGPRRRGRGRRDEGDGKSGPRNFHLSR